MFVAVGRCAFVETVEFGARCSAGEQVVVVGTVIAFRDDDLAVCACASVNHRNLVDAKPGENFGFFGIADAASSLLCLPTLRSMALAQLDVKLAKL